MRVAYPAMASSTELSTTSQTRWWSPLGPVEPMYMPGRLRTGSRPSRTVMSWAVYSEPIAVRSSASAFITTGATFQMGCRSLAGPPHDRERRTLVAGVRRCLHSTVSVLAARAFWGLRQGKIHCVDLGLTLTLHRVATG